MSKRQEAFLVIIASLLGLAVLVMYLSATIAINLEPSQQLIVYMPTPRPKIIEQTNYVTVTKLITREVYVSRPTEVPPPIVEAPAPVVQAEVAWQPEQAAAAEAPAPEAPAQAEVISVQPPAALAVAAAPPVPEPTAVPPPPPWGDQPTFTTLSMGKEGYASWYDGNGTKHHVSLRVNDMAKESFVGALMASAANGGDVTLCVSGECATNGGAFEASPFSVAGVTATYAGNGEWNVVANEGVLTRF